MTPEDMSALHKAAFAHDRPWTAAEFRDLRASAHVTAFTAPQGFALTRTIAGESELLTLAVAPAAQRQGIAGNLMENWLFAAAPHAETAFLEVAADNFAARRLYARFGFAQIAQRPAYYARKGAPAVDALILSRVLTMGQGSESPPKTPESG